MHHSSLRHRLSNSGQTDNKKLAIICFYIYNVNKAVAKNNGSGNIFLEESL